MEQAIHTPEQQKWLHKLLGYDFTIEYKPGKDNIAADSLSRFCFMAWSQPNFQILHAIREAVSQDPHLKGVLDLCLLNQPPNPHYTVQDNLLLWKGRLVIPQSHGMNKDVQQFVQACLICQQAKMSHTLHAGLLQPLPIPKQIWEEIAIDFITGLPPSNGFTVILVVVDRLSKYGHFSPLKADYFSKSVAENFVKSVVKLHGTPKTIVSDRDKVFLSHFLQQLFKLSGTSLHLSTTYHPQSDGQSESLNKCLEMYLRCFTYESPKDWAKLLPWAEYWYNTSYHHNCGMTPFKIVYGRDRPALDKYNRNPHDSLSVQDQLLQRDVTISKLKVNLYKAQQYMKKHADKKRRFMELQIGDLVLVKLQPYRQHTVALRKNQKLSMRFFGPFPVIQRIGLVAYKLLLPPTTKIHPVFHCSQLKPCKGNYSQPYVPLPITSNDLPPVLVQWEGLEQAFPNLNLEDKVGLNVGGIVTHVERAEGSNVNTPHQGVRKRVNWTILFCISLCRISFPFSDALQALCDLAYVTAKASEASDEVNENEVLGKMVSEEALKKKSLEWISGQDFGKTVKQTIGNDILKKALEHKLESSHKDNSTYPMNNNSRNTSIISNKVERETLKC
ncbi:hypothetical protein V8G54_012491 [Vigna mungo]|uniref:Integrase catalytic domain-containing protein n=1 Tax=Vigna mungo TaxID=3915 RepID=A0AAQ3NR91_VIGMU